MQFIRRIEQEVEKLEQADIQVVDIILDSLDIQSEHAEDMTTATVYFAENNKSQKAAFDMKKTTIHSKGDTSQAALATNISEVLEWVKTTGKAMDFFNMNVHFSIDEDGRNTATTHLYFDKSES